MSREDLVMFARICARGYWWNGELAVPTLGRHEQRMLHRNNIFFYQGSINTIDLVDPTCYLIDIDGITENKSNHETFSPASSSS